MNYYMCHIDLKQEAKALAFAAALDKWMTFLKDEGTIQSWRLSRRKLNLASGATRDFLLEIEFENLAQMDDAFRCSGDADEDVRQMYHAMHDHIAGADFGLYRSFPDPQRSERVALI